MRRLGAKKLWWAGAALTPLVAWLSWMLLLGNFYTVVPAELFRSAQPSRAQLARYAHDHQLRAVVNLRGEEPGADWWEAERAEAQRLGLAHVDLRFSAVTEPSLEQMDELVDVMRRAPRPLLVHCMAGADRTGLAVALYRYAVLGQPADEARGGLSLLQGHFPWLWSRTDAMDRAFERYVSQRVNASASSSAPAPRR